jgi:hypothetical protein
MKLVLVLMLVTALATVLTARLDRAPDSAASTVTAARGSR